MPMIATLLLVIRRWEKLNILHSRNISKDCAMVMVVHGIHVHLYSTLHSTWDRMSGSFMGFSLHEFHEKKRSHVQPPFKKKDRWQVTHIKHNKSLFKNFKREEKLFIWHFFSLLPFFFWPKKRSSYRLILTTQTKQNDALLHGRLKSQSDLRGIIVPYAWCLRAPLNAHLAKQSLFSKQTEVVHINRWVGLV